MPSRFKEIRRLMFIERESISHAPDDYPQTTEQAISLIKATGQPYLDVHKVQYFTIAGKRYARVALPPKLIAYWGYPSHLYLLYNTGYILLYPAYVIKEIDLNTTK
jgi:hypothetical protein